MGGVSSGPDGLNVELNLVPFIDLLSALVLFLLLSAVWVQISAIGTAVDSKGGTPVVNPDQRVLMIHMTKQGHALAWPQEYTGYPTVVVKNDKGFDIQKLLEIVKAVSGEGKQPITAVSADDYVEYGQVVRTIDIVKEGGLKSVALSAQ